MVRYDKTTGWLAFAINGSTAVGSNRFYLFHNDGKINVLLFIKFIMNKTTKTWLWIFIAMFAVPEILFFTTISAIASIISNFSETSIIPPIYYFFDKHFFADYPIFPLLIMIIEWIGVLKLLLISIKSNKKIISSLLGVILLWLSFIIYVGYVIGFSMSLF